ncbi:MAG TPA: hypothetical protein VLB73_04815, partial [Patescibacteria group bacterium]|nr:hypothetical protein [Patescibacteria group bacterium]
SDNFLTPKQLNFHLPDNLNTIYIYFHMTEISSGYWRFVFDQHGRIIGEHKVFDNYPNQPTSQTPRPAEHNTSQPPRREPSSPSNQRR